MINYTQVEQAIGYTFHNKALLEQALTHSSFISDIHHNYERLEFLGDRILGVTIADLLYQTFKDESEGSLSQRFVRLVCKETVAEVVVSLKINDYILTPNPTVKEQVNVLCDVGEAIIAAIYKDCGEMKVAQNFILKQWLPHIDKKSQPKKDYKTLLQEKAHILGFSQPIYSVVDKQGSEHEPVFIVKVTLDQERYTIGEGKSKKLAELNAAHNLLLKLGLNDE